MKQILCLPGFATNGKIMQYQVRQFSQHLKDHYELLYMDPTHFFDKSIIEDEGVVKLLSMFDTDAQLYTWGKFTRCNKPVSVYSEDMERLKQTIIDNPNIEGLLSFSQAGNIINLACQAIEDGDELLKNRIKFVIIISYNQYTLDRDFNSQVKFYKTKSLHFYGFKDFMGMECLMNSGRYLNPTVIEHDQGHKIPKLNTLQLKQLDAFLNIKPRPRL